jgi:hypothetical protein
VGTWATIEYKRKKELKDKNEKNENINWLLWREEKHT